MFLIILSVVLELIGCVCFFVTVEQKLWWFCMILQMGCLRFCVGLLTSGVVFLFIGRGPMIFQRFSGRLEILEGVSDCVRWFWVEDYLFEAVLADERMMGGMVAFFFRDVDVCWNVSVECFFDALHGMLDWTLNDCRPCWEHFCESVWMVCGGAFACSWCWDGFGSSLFLFKCGCAGMPESLVFLSQRDLLGKRKQQSV